MSFLNKMFGNTPDAVVIPPPIATTASTDLSCTLKLWKNEKVLHNPTEADIRAAVTALSNDEMGPRLLLKMDGCGSQIQLTGTPQDGFAFEYRERSADAEGCFYSSERYDYPTEMAIKVLSAYRSGVADWATMVVWKKLRL
jgi:hypothetical protein